jgi:hypothetical protein
MSEPTLSGSVPGFVLAQLGLSARFPITITGEDVHETGLIWDSGDGDLRDDEDVARARPRRCVAAGCLSHGCRQSAA